MLKRIVALAKDALTYGASSAVSQIVGFLLLPLYTSHLSPADYGVVGTLSLALAVVGAVGAAGIPAGLTRFLMIENEGPALATVRIGTTFIASAVSCAVVAGALSIAEGPIALLLLGESGHGTAYLYAVGAGALSAISGVPEGILRADRKVTSIAGVALTKLVVSTAATLALLFGADLRAEAILGGQLAGEVVGLLVGLVVVRRRLSLAWSTSELRVMGAYALPLLPHRVQGIVLVLFGQYVVRAMLGLEQAGLFALATKFATPVTFFVNALQRAWVPFKLEIQATEPDSASVLRSLVTYYLAGLAWVWLVVAVGGADLLVLVVHPSFAPASELVALVALGPLALGLYFMLGTGFEVSRDTRPAPLISLAGLVVVVILSYTLVPMLGAAGAALATLAGRLTMVAGVYYVAQQRFTIRYDWLVVGGAIALAAALALAHTATPRGSLASMAVGAGAVLVFPLGCLVLLLRSESERGRVRRLFARRRMTDAESR